MMKSIFKITENYGPEPYKIDMGVYFGVVITKPEDIQVLILLIPNNFINNI